MWDRIRTCEEKLANQSNRTHANEMELLELRESINLFEVKNSKFDSQMTKFEMQNSKNREAINAKLDEMQDFTEKKLFNTMQAIIQDTNDNKRSCETSSIRLEDQIAQLRTSTDRLHAQSLHLTELTQLKEYYPTIIDGLQGRIADICIEKLAIKFEDIFASDRKLQEIAKDADDKYLNLRTELVATR